MNPLFMQDLYGGYGMPGGFGGCGCGPRIEPPPAPAFANGGCFPQQGFPPSPMEQQQSDMYRHIERQRGAVKGGIGGAATGAAAGAGIGFFLGGPIGAGIGAVVGGIFGAIGGSSAGRAIADHRAIVRDANDDCRLNGSPMYYQQNPWGYQGTF